MKRAWMGGIAGALAAVLIAGCGGGDDETTIKTDDGEVSVSSEGKVPDDFPDDFPVYDGADVQGSITGTQNGISGTVVTWETDDSLDDVKAFYDEEFADGPWTASASGNVAGTAYWAGENDDGSQAMYVGISESDGKTVIVVTVGDNDSASDAGDDTGSDDSSSDDGSSDDSSSDDSSSDDGSSAELPEEAELPDDFPTDRVPLPSGARVTQATTTSAGGVASYFLELYVKDDAGGAADALKADLTSAGWTETVTSQSGGEYFLTFSAGENEVVTATISDADVEGYVVVSIAAVVSE